MKVLPSIEKTAVWSLVKLPDIENFEMPNWPPIAEIPERDATVPLFLISFRIAFATFSGVGVLMSLV